MLFQDDTVADNFGSELVQYNGVTLNDARKSLKELDEKLIKLASVEVNNAAVANAHPPRGIGFGKKSEFTEQSLLDHQLNLKRRQPPRKVIPRARQALMEYFPCWMMVPSEVAQLLPRSADFDLVIIDEASLCDTASCLPALQRAKRVVITGDPNQLRHLSFLSMLAKIRCLKQPRHPTWQSNLHQPHHLPRLFTTARISLTSNYSAHLTSFWPIVYISVYLHTSHLDNCKYISTYFPAVIL